MYAIIVEDDENDYSEVTSVLIADGFKEVATIRTKWDEGWSKARIDATIEHRAKVKGGVIPYKLVLKHVIDILGTTDYIEFLLKNGLKEIPFGY